MSPGLEPNFGRDYGSVTVIVFTALAWRLLLSRTSVVSSSARMSVWLGLVNRLNKFPDAEHFSGMGIKSEAWTGGGCIPLSVKHRKKMEKRAQNVGGGLDPEKSLAGGLNIVP
jgi:hypothetical protein